MNPLSSLGPLLSNILQLGGTSNDLLINVLSLLTLGESSLGSVHLVLVAIEFSQHLHDSLLFSHHFLDNLVEQILRVLGHLESLQLLLGLSRRLQDLIVHVSLSDHLVGLTGSFPHVNQVLEGAHLSLVEIVPPLTIRGVVLLHELLNLVGVPALEAEVRRVIQFADGSVDHGPVVSVVDFLLVHRCLNYFVPELCIVVFQEHELFSQTEEHPLVEDHLCLPLVEQHLFELGVQKFVEMSALDGPIVSEGLHELVNLLGMQHFESVLKLGLPPIDAEPGALISLVVGPESAEAVSGH